MYIHFPGEFSIYIDCANLACKTAAINDHLRGFSMETKPAASSEPGSYITRSTLPLR